MGYRLNRLDEPVFMAVRKPMLTEFGIHHRLESCVTLTNSARENFLKLLTLSLTITLYVIINYLYIFDGGLSRLTDILAQIIKVLQKAEKISVNLT